MPSLSLPDPDDRRVLALTKLSVPEFSSCSFEAHRLLVQMMVVTIKAVRPLSSRLRSLSVEYNACAP